MDEVQNNGGLSDVWAFCFRKNAYEKMLKIKSIQKLTSTNKD
jgi:hypothetical protein